MTSKYCLISDYYFVFFNCGDLVIADKEVVCMPHIGIFCELTLARSWVYVVVDVYFLV